MGWRMGPTRRDFLWGSSAALLSSPLAHATTRSTPRRLLYVFANGGWDTTFVVDPKLGADIDGPWVDEDPKNPDDEEYVATYGEDLSVNLNEGKRPSVSAFFERFGSRCAIINGCLTTLAHDPARVKLFTGTDSSKRPDLKTIVGAIHGKDLPLGSFDLSGMSFTGPLAASTGQLGFASQMTTLVEPSRSFPAPDWTEHKFPQYVPSRSDRALLDAYLHSETERSAAAWLDGGLNDQVLADRLESLQRAQRFEAEGADLLSTLVPGRAADFLGQLELAVEILSRDLAASVMVDTAISWDSHDLNAQQHNKYEETFFALNHMGTLLEEKGLLDDTLVIITSEMTRTPKLNAKMGKDHWPWASAILLGAGIRPGRSFGGTNDNVEGQPMDLASGSLYDDGDILTFESMNAGFLQCMGIDPGSWLPGVKPFTGFLS